MNMAQPFTQSITEIDKVIELVNQAIPLVGTPSKSETVQGLISQVSDLMKSENLDRVSPHFRPLGTTLKILISSGSPFLGTVTFQAFLLEISETLTEVKSLLNSAGVPDPEVIKDLRTNGEFLIRMAGRILYRYKIIAQFEPDYDAKVLRAFMLAKDLSKQVRFLNVDPDISQQSNPNLDNGLTLEVLSQSPPQELHETVMKVLSVESCQIFIERREENVLYLDPPYIPGSVDDRMDKYLNE